MTVPNDQQLDVPLVLVVEDEESFVEALTLGLQREGFRVKVALDGVEFTVGTSYLVTAVDGVVQPCGVSAPASPELEALYDEWYG